MTTTAIHSDPRIDAVRGSGVMAPASRSAVAVGTYPDRARSARAPTRPATTGTTLRLRPFAEFDGGAAMRVWIPAAAR